MNSLEKIRALLQKDANKNPQSRTKAETGLVYPHWEAEYDSTQTVRFLPDADDQNSFFWRERQQIKLKFETTDEEPKATYITLPSLATWGEKCPLKERASQEYERDAKAAGTLGIWPKKSYLFNALVVEGSIKEAQPAPSPIRLILANTSLFKIINNAIMDPELENIPTDYKTGRDFRIKKTRKGEYAEYSTSSFAMRERPLSKEEMDIVTKNDLHNLSERLGKKPSQSDTETHLEILEAYINGDSFDTSRWGKML